MRYDIFICYETSTAGDLAEHVADCAEKRLGAKAFAAVRSGDIPPGYPNELEFRYNAIENSSHLLLIATNTISNSPEVKKEIEQACKFNKPIIICPDTQLNRENFKNNFPNLKDTQTLPKWSSKFELAKRVADWYIGNNLIETKNIPEISAQNKGVENTGLIIRPKWSLTTVTNNNSEGQIIFVITNKTNQLVSLHGYRMFRISPDGIKDFYYKGMCVDADKYQNWAYSKHFQILLLPDDFHGFHWGKVKIPETYGINRKGMWSTEIQIAYIQQNTPTLRVAVGRTEIKFE